MAGKKFKNFLRSRFLKIVQNVNMVANGKRNRRLNPVGLIGAYHRNGDNHGGIKRERQTSQGMIKHIISFCPYITQTHIVVSVNMFMHC